MKYRRANSIQTGANVEVTQGRNGPAISMRKAPGKYPRFAPFTLSRGADGARIYFGQFVHAVSVANFERISIKGKKVNSLESQEEVPTLTAVTPEQMEHEDEDDKSRWTDLDWWGDVYLTWVCDEETGEVSDVKLEGPDEPEDSPIPELNDELEREEGEGEGTRGAYFLKLGAVPEDDDIEQIINSDIYWCPMLFTGEGGGSGSGSDDDSGDDSGDSGESKSSAIVKAEFSSTGYTALFVEEAPEVLFNDVMRVPVRGRRTVVQIDPRFRLVCEPGSLVVVSACPNAPAMVGASIDGDMITICVSTPILRRRPSMVVLRITGIRLGFAGLRFPNRTLADYLANEAFLKSAKPS